MKVLLPAAGIGSRLGNLTTHFNKALLAIGKRPVISHIIDWYPREAEFVIALGYYGEHIREYLTLAYPDRKFTFVDVDHFQGPGSGLGYTLKKCKPHLNEPFFFHANDSIVKDDIDFFSFNKDTMFVSKSYVDPKKYRTVELTDDKKTIKHIFDKSEQLETEKLYNYIGVAFFQNYEAFCQHLDEISIEIGESDFFMKKCKTVHSEVMNQWFDIGSVDQYRTATHNLSDFENLAKDDEGIFFNDNKVIKFFTNPANVQKRVQRASLLKGIVPEIKEVSKHFYVYHFSPGALLSEKNNVSKTFAQFLTWCQRGLWKEEKINHNDMHKFENTCFNFYYTKTMERIDQFFVRFEWQDQAEVINDEAIPPLRELLERVNWTQLKSGTPVLFHGDLHFENILQTESGFMLIDWRQGFGDEIKYGDVYYDLAKLYHGLIINHGIIRKNLFKIDHQKKNIEFDFNRRFALIECEEVLKSFVIENGYSWNKVEVLTGLIFLNIAALHHYPYSHLLFYLGKTMIWKHTQGEKK